MCIFIFLGIAYLSSSMVKKVIEEHEEREAKYENEKASMTVPENFKKFMEDSKYVIKLISWLII